MKTKTHTILRTLALLTLLHLHTGCRTTRTTPLPTPEHHNREYARQQQTDTLILHDSIYVEQRGDTLRIEKYHIRWRQHIRHDSIHITDTLRIPYPVEVTRTVGRPLSRWQRIIQSVGYLTLTAAALCLLRRLRR
ncbi:MAG: hypothetical protein J1E02_05855 [Coprobacter sp.]|nr:hypothetical protein [Coprobacter sp.]